MKPSLTLSGLCLLNTRPKEQGLPLQQQIVAAGGACVNLPVLNIEPCTISQAICYQSTLCRYAIFTSANAVKHYFQRLTNYQLTFSKNTRVIAIGKATATMLKKEGIQTHYLPEEANSEALLTLPELQQVRAQTITLIKGEKGRELLAKELLKRGALVQEVIAYRRTLPDYPLKTLQALRHKYPINIILITSEQALDNLFQLLGTFDEQWLLNTPAIVISPRLATIAEQRGIKTIIISHYDKLINTLYNFNSANSHNDN